MKLLWSDNAWEDYLFWQSENPNTLQRINDILKDAMRNPFTGLGKPEPLRGDLQSWRSRRINTEHRLVYRVSGKAPGQTLDIAQCRYHYGR